MLKILWKRGKIAPEEQFLPLSTIFYYLMLDFCVKTGITFSLRDKRLFEITEVEITRVDCIYLGYVSLPRIDSYAEKLHYKSRKENPQKPTQLSSRSHPRHLVGKRTAQKTPS